MFSMGNAVSNIVLTCTVTDGDYTYCGDHFTVYRNVESLCCIHDINVILHVDYTSIKNMKGSFHIL